LIRSLFDAKAREEILVFFEVKTPSMKEGIMDSRLPLLLSADLLKKIQRQEERRLDVSSTTFMEEREREREREIQIKQVSRESLQ
jgi:hypothetical protein